MLPIFVRPHLFFFSFLFSPFFVKGKKKRQNKQTMHMKPIILCFPFTNINPITKTKTKTKNHSLPWNQFFVPKTKKKETNFLLILIPIWQQMAVVAWRPVLAWFIIFTLVVYEEWISISLSCKNRTLANLNWPLKSTTWTTLRLWW